MADSDVSQSPGRSTAEEDRNYEADRAAERREIAAEKTTRMPFWRRAIAVVAASLALLGTGAVANEYVSIGRDSEAATTQVEVVDIPSDGQIIALTGDVESGDAVQLQRYEIPVPFSDETVVAEFPANWSAEQVDTALSALAKVMKETLTITALGSSSQNETVYRICNPSNDADFLARYPTVTQDDLDNLRSDLCK